MQASEVRDMNAIRRSVYEDLKREFIRYKGSLKKFAEEHAAEAGVVPKTIQEFGRRHHWIADREKYLDKVDAKALSRMADTDAVKKADALELQGIVAEALTEVLKKALSDPDQFFRHLIQSTRNGDTDVEERVYDKMDAKAFKETAQALKDLVTVTRNVNELPTLAEKQAQAEREERLKLDKEKLEKANADGSTTIRLVFDDPENDLYRPDDAEDVECEGGEPVVKSVTEWDDGTVDVEE